MDVLGSQLEENPFLGDSLGAGLYKVRLRITSKGKSKSGGARVITCVKVIHTTVYLLSIYDKSEREDISDKELKFLMGHILNLKKKMLL